MELSDASGQTFDMELAGQKFKVKHVGMLSIQAEFEAEIRSEYNRGVLKAVEDFKLKGEERLNFLAATSRFDSMPSGQSLARAVQEKMNGMEGVCKILSKAICLGGTKITDDEISAIVLADPVAATHWAGFLAGVEKKMPTPIATS